MKKVRAAIVGYGNIGHFVLEALQAAPDFEIAGVVRRAGAENRPAELSEYSVVKDIKELKDVDVAIICNPRRKLSRQCLLFLPVGIREVTPLGGPCWKLLPRKVLRTLTLVRV